jgi:hypothetical protein
LTAGLPRGKSASASEALSTFLTGEPRCAKSRLRTGETSLAAVPLLVPERTLGAVSLSGEPAAGAVPLLEVFDVVGFN